MQNGYLFILLLLINVSVKGQNKMTTTQIKSEAEMVVQKQLEAYNNGDLEAFLNTYSEDIKIFNHPNTLTMEGISALRERYGKLFKENPNNHAEIVNRVTQGNFVIDKEHITGRSNGQELFAIAIYQVHEGKITNVWFIR